MSIPACKGVSPETLGLTSAEISQLDVVDRVVGDGDGVATVGEYDRFLMVTFRGPDQVLPREPWVQERLQQLQDAGSCGVRVRKT